MWKIKERSDMILDVLIKHEFLQIKEMLQIYAKLLKCFIAF